MNFICLLVGSAIGMGFAALSALAWIIATDIDERRNR